MRTYNWWDALAADGALLEAQVGSPASCRWACGRCLGSSVHLVDDHLGRKSSAEVSNIIEGVDYRKESPGQEGIRYQHDRAYVGDRLPRGSRWQAARVPRRQRLRGASRPCARPVREPRKEGIIREMATNNQCETYPLALAVRLATVPLAVDVLHEVGDGFVVVWILIIGVSLLQLVVVVADAEDQILGDAVLEECLLVWPVLVLEMSA